MKQRLSKWGVAWGRSPHNQESPAGHCLSTGAKAHRGPRAVRRTPAKRCPERYLSRIAARKRSWNACCDQPRY